MKIKIVSILVSLLCLNFVTQNLYAKTATKAPAPGDKAPAFSVKDVNGKVVSLSDFAGEWLVLEWYNKDCPFVKKHYNPAGTKDGKGNMQSLQEKYTAKQVKWVSIISSAKRKQGYLEPKDAIEVMKASGTKVSHMLLDTDGKMARTYDAKTTPHMFIINPKGIIVYAGAIDSNDSDDPADIEKATNFVSTTLDHFMDPKMKNEKLKLAFQKPYGCSIKF